jgi:hypothetical protein
VASGSLGRRAGLIAAGQATVKASQLVIAIALVRLLSPATWSQVALLLSIYLAAVTIGTLNLQQSLLFFLPRLETPDSDFLLGRFLDFAQARGIELYPAQEEAILELYMQALGMS